ncbi:MAG: hypothetical protein MZV64_15745 [Ignavibacteriales bacterium]|nr:hypothetical protein [Ignavibacteriales bacterium]
MRSSDSLPRTVGGVTRVDAAQRVDLDEVQVAAASLYGRRLDVALNIDGRADIGVAIRQLGVTADQHGDAAAHQRAHRNIDVVTCPELNGQRRVDQAVVDTLAELRGAGLQDVQVLARACRIRTVRRIARVRKSPSGRSARIHLGHVYAGLGIYEQASDAGYRPVDLHRVRRLAGAVDLNIVGGRADRAGEPSRCSCPGCRTRCHRLHRTSNRSA